MRGFADTDASGVIARLRVTAEDQALEVTRSAFGGRLSGTPRRAVITHAVAANERASVTLSVRTRAPRAAPRARALAGARRSMGTSAPPRTPAPRRPPCALIGPRAVAAALSGAGRCCSQVRAWQPSEQAALSELEEALRSPEAVQAMTAADGAATGIPPPLFRDYAYESRE